MAPDEVFFHKYFTHRGAETRQKRKRAKERGGVEREEEEEEEEEEIWGAMVDSRPELVLDDEQADMDDVIDLSESDGFEGVSKISEHNKWDDSDIDAEEPNMTFLDPTIFGSHSYPASRLQKEGNDTWEAEDDNGMSSDTDMGLDKILTTELKTSSSGRIPLARLNKPLAKHRATEMADRNVEDEDSVKKHKKQKLRHLPTFASVEDYADLLLD